MSANWCEIEAELGISDKRDPTGEPTVGLRRGGAAAVLLARAPVAHAPKPRRIELVTNPAQVQNLAPDIFRQRLVVEGTCPERIDQSAIKTYLNALSEVCGMNALIDPVTHRSDLYGWAGWIHWETSGAHFYAWDDPLIFFSADIYTCKAFDAMATVEFTREFFDADQIVATGF